MASKTITIREDVYDKLKALKRPGESFSEELERLADSRDNLEELAGTWDLTEDEADELIEDIHGRRDHSRIGERIDEAT